MSVSQGGVLLGGGQRKAQGLCAAVMQVHAEGSSVLFGHVGPVLMVVNELFGRYIPNGAMRRRLHLAIPPGAARSPFNYTGIGREWCSLRGDWEGGAKTDGDHLAH